MKQYVPTWSTLCLVIICFVCFVETEFQSVGQDDLSLLCRPGRPGAWGHSLLLPLPPEEEDYILAVSEFTCWAFFPAPGELSATVTKSNLGGLSQLSGSSMSPTKGSQDRSLVPASRNWSWDNTGTLLALLGLLADFCIHPRPTSLGMELPSKSWAFLDQLTIKTCPACAQANLMETITQWGSLFPGV